MNLIAVLRSCFFLKLLSMGCKQDHNALDYFGNERSSYGNFVEQILHLTARKCTYTHVIIGVRQRYILNYMSEYIHAIF